ncbi:hypothetical protein [Luteimonas sp. MC1750]|uniref:hypothetical protein n=1 Tax=Luteimonas sp. MC1750 TaxID=2799326 RepID=UPI0018F06F6D|nr:hypothetical protein [Luteimonas sp. MC1750]MBJ6983965.1 hypothetical protein [Luteimonas sp. MC1750]QQO06778.1 hypothetical protein JGR68_04965 [Luteimonas sp. MC1750]
MRVQINTAAIDDVVPNPRLQLIAANLRHEPERLELLPLTMRLHTAWQQDAKQVVMFFMRDNPKLIPEAEELLALDHLTGWRDGMWEAAVEEDSLSKLVVLHLANVEPSRQPAAGLIEAIQAEKYEVAAYYIAYWGHVAGPGIKHCWTDLCADLWKAGDGRPHATAQLICAMMKRSAAMIWKRDFERLAKKFPAQGRPIKMVRAYLEEQAEMFEPLPTVLQLYASGSDIGSKVHENLSDADKLAFAASSCWLGIEKARTLDVNDHDQKKLAEKIMGYMRDVSKGLDRGQLARKMAEKEGAPGPEQIMKALDNIGAGETAEEVSSLPPDLMRKLAISAASLAILLAQSLDLSDPDNRSQLEKAFEAARGVSEDLDRSALVDAVIEDLQESLPRDVVMNLFTKMGIGKAD